MDLYQVLNVPREASGDEIERAYRRLARRYHPDINPGDTAAAEAYRRIQDAYDVLRDVTERRRYDRGGLTPVAATIEATVAFQGFDFSALAEGPGAATFSELFADVFQQAARRATTADLSPGLPLSLSLSFEDAVLGGSFPLSILRRERCPGCGGAGSTPRPPLPCPACAAEGTRRWARGHMVFAKACDHCGGTGQLTCQTCRTCGGACVFPRSEVVTVTIPPGLESGARIVIPGRGHVPLGGGPVGDVYVTVEVAAHPFFRREGRDLRLSLPVAVHEAALGARVDVPTLDGSVKLRIPPGTSSGQRLRVRGQGVPSPTGGDAGDLIVEVHLVLPPVCDERSKELLREFGRLNGEDVRRHLFAGRA